MKGSDNDENALPSILEASHIDNNNS